MSEMLLFCAGSLDYQMVGARSKGVFILVIKTPLTWIVIQEYMISMHFKLI